MLVFALQDRIPRPSFLLGGFALALLLGGAGAAIAQDAAGANKPQEPAAVTTGKTRPRQVTPPPSDPLSPLRDDIAAAATPEERARLQFKLVDQLAAANRKPEAIAELHAMTGADRFDPPGYFNVGNALVRLDDADGAIDAYRKAIEQRK